MSAPCNAWIPHADDFTLICGCDACRDVVSRRARTDPQFVFGVRTERYRITMTAEHLLALWSREGGIESLLGLRVEWARAFRDQRSRVRSWA